MAEAEIQVFPVKELVAQCYEALGIPSHVAVGAMTLAGAREDDAMTVEQFKAAVEAFLSHPIA
ncbi:MAG TPA: hypothetical protein VK464_04175 [Symbiobacteriaceae bacterium]|jgi:hypothetical protein|nr:hypothetical protein [Symbiobacteriaceae bacterium]